MWNLGWWIINISPINGEVKVGTFPNVIVNLEDGDGTYKAYEYLEVLNVKRSLVNNILNDELSNLDEIINAIKAELLW